MSEDPVPSTRDRILAAATQLFLSASVEAVSVAEICRAAGVSNGSFFHHFPNKEMLALEATLALRREYWEHLLAALEPCTDPMEGIARVIRAAFDYLRRFPEKYEFSRSDEAPWMDAGNVERVRADNAPYRGRAAMWIATHVAARKLPLLAPEVYGALMFGTPHWVARNAHSRGAPTDFDAVAEELVRSVQKALTPEPN